MASHRIVCLCLCVAACAPIVSSDPDPTGSGLDRAFRDYTLVQLAPEAVADVAAQGRLVLSLPESELVLQLVPRDLRAAGYRAEVTDASGRHDGGGPEVRTFRGGIAGDPTSHVRLATSTDGVAGYYVLAGERFFMEPARAYTDTEAEGALVIYRGEDALREDAAACDHVHEQLETGTRAFAMEEARAPRVIELATDADEERVARDGGAAQANSEILAVLNLVEGVYEAELGITFEVTYQHAWVTPDPYDATSKPALLASFRATWEQQFPRDVIARDVAHLFSANPIVDAAGRATLDVICRDPARSYAVSGHVDYQPARALIAAHELAHVIGAIHRDAGACAGTVMSPVLSYLTPLTFCADSRADVAAALAIHGTCLGVEEPPPPSSSLAERFDFTGDGRADLSVFRPNEATWYVAVPTGLTGVPWGIATDRLVPADYDGDAKVDPAIVRDGVWWRLFSRDLTHDAIGWGNPDDVPVPGDYDGDGKADIAIFRPSNGQWWVLRSTGGHYALEWGLAGDIPVVSDVDGDARADYVVFRPSTGVWYRMTSSTLTVSIVSWGQPGDVPLAGDFDGDGRDDAAVFRPSNTGWYVVHSSDGALVTTMFGAAGDRPVPADYDGDGRTDLAVFRPATSSWYLITAAGYSVTPFGVPGDIPVPAP